LEVYLGIDVGSVSTKLAVFDRNDGLVTYTYMLTEGKPVTMVQVGGRCDLWEESPSDHISQSRN